MGKVEEVALTETQRRMLKVLANSQAFAVPISLGDLASPDLTGLFDAELVIATWVGSFIPGACITDAGRAALSEDKEQG